MTARLPLLLFLGAYLFSCYVGALALLFSVRFRTLFLIFSGSEPVDLSYRDLAIVLVLLHAGPAALWVGYEAGLRLRAGRWLGRWIAGSSAVAMPRVVPWAAFGLTLAMAVWSLARVGGLDTAVAAWLDYNAYVRERWRWFAALGFFEFVNLYTLLPICAAAVMLTERRWRVVAGCAAVVLALQYPLSIRKVLLTSLMLMAFAGYAYATLGTRPRWRPEPGRQLAVGVLLPAALYAVYVGLTLLTTLGPRSQAFQALSVDSARALEARGAIRADQARMRSQEGPGAVAVEAGLTAADVDGVVRDRTSAVVLYTLLAPLTRTSICAVVYPVIFPRWHPYYRLDVGLDILGWGGMPDDNLVVYRYLWPDHDHGSVAAPFHVVLYSQGGLGPAIIGSALVGIVLALSWSLVATASRPGVPGSLLAAIILTFAVFLAVDSLRNSLVVTYGMIWGAAATLALWLAARARHGAGVAGASEVP